MSQTGIAVGVPPSAAHADSRPMLRLSWIRPVAVFVLLSGLLLALTIAHMYQREMENGRKLTLAMAQLVEEQTSRVFQSVDQQLQSVQREFQRLEASGNRDPAAGSALLRRHFQGMSFVRAVWITDAGGRVTDDTLESSTQPDVSDRRYFQIYQQRPGTGFYIGDPMRSRVTGQWLISASRPIVSPDGVFRGVVVAAIEPIYFEQVWGAAHQLLGGAIGLWRSDGMLMMRSPSGDTAIGRTYPQLPLFHQPESASAAGTFSNRSPFDGESRIYAYRRLPTQPDFIIAVGQSKALLTASWRNFTAISLAIWLFCCGAIVLLGSFLDRVWQQNQRGKEMLRTTSERLELATEAGVIGTFDLDLVHDRLHGSPTYWGQVGQPADAMATSRSEWLERVHPEDRSIVAENIRRATEQDNSAFAHDIRVQHQDGSYRWMREAGRVMAHDADGRAMRLLGTRIDITEHKQREQQLIAAERSVRAGEERYRMLFEHAPGGIGITTGANRLTEVNAELCELLGYGREELIGKAIADLILPAQRKQIDSALQALMHGMGKRREWTLVHKSGATLVAEVVSTIMPDGRIMNLVHDVTQRKEGEESLRTLLQEQEALLREVHHRVKNNLQLIHSMLRLETSRCRFGEARAALLDMQERVQSIALLHGMLCRRGRFASVDLGSYLYHLCHEAMRAGNARARGIRLQLELASVPLDMDQAMCCGLIVNELLSNCLKHAFPDRDGGQIRVQLQAVDGGARLQLRVSDDGIGLAGDPAQAPATTMGMQLVADLTLQLEGQLDVDAGPGAAFCVSFVPARPAQRTPPSDTHAQPSLARPAPTHFPEA